ncbi:MAG: hypothetical protein M1817_005017 [Caeruleum heppii]|nr:MAG: hypothetical protein M1817_005017 [Caeruleum heppii]
MTTLSTELLSRLLNLTSSQKHTTTLINRLSHLPIQPGSSPLNPSVTDSSDGDARIELAQEIHQSLKEQEDALELLKQDIEDLPSSTRSEAPERGRLEVGIRRAGEDLKTARSQFRTAQLHAARSASQAQRQERELLFANRLSASQASTGKGSSTLLGQGPGRRRGAGHKELTQDELVANASSDVTASLRRTHQLMQAELGRSQFAHDTLQESTQALTSLSESYSSLQGLLTSSRTLLGTLLRSQKSDTWYLETAFYILISTIVWLVFRRFFYGPLWWFVWLPLKVFYRTLAGVFVSVGSVLGASTPSRASSASSSLIVKVSATGQGQRATFASRVQGQADEVPNMVIVGGGGKGGPAPAAPPGRQQQEQAHDQQESLSEEVGKMVDESRGREGVPGQGADGSAEEGVSKSEEDAPRNPKKRMWEEDVEAAKHEAQQRDEL